MAKKKWKKKERLEKKEAELGREEKGSSKAVTIAVLLIIVVAGYYLFGPPSSPAQTPPPTKPIEGSYVQFPDKPNTHVSGKVSLIEFFDFYCSHCYSFHKDTWPALKKKYGDKIELADLGYPLRETSILPLEAYEIAKDFGKGEELKDAMFTAIHEEERDISNVEALSGLAEGVGLDKAIFASALESRSKSKVVDDNRRLGNSYKLTGTPTIIIDGNIKATGTSAANLQTIIDSILEGE
jgi:protein-disulfide isomerase